jgi:hypothetical protein
MFREDLSLDVMDVEVQENDFNSFPLQSTLHLADIEGSITIKSTPYVCQSVQSDDDVPIPSMNDGFKISQPRGKPSSFNEKGCGGKGPKSPYVAMLSASFGMISNGGACSIVCSGSSP